MKNDLECLRVVVASFHGPKHRGQVGRLGSQGHRQQAQQ